MKILKLLSHPNVIRLEEFRESSQSVAVIMEYGGQRNFAEYIQHHRSQAKNRHKRPRDLRGGVSSKNRLHIPHLLEIYLQVLRGVEYLHEQHVGHRDLKLENIVLMEPEESLQSNSVGEGAVREDSRQIQNLVSNATPEAWGQNFVLDVPSRTRKVSFCKLDASNEAQDLCHARKRIPKVKIIDFGFAVHTTGHSDLRCGTPVYMSPEIVQKHKYLPSKVDVWALGVILFKIVFNSVPFHATSLSDLYHRIVTQELVFPSSTHSSCPTCKVLLPQVKELLATMLNKDPNLRPTVSEASKHLLFSTLAAVDARHLVSASQSAAGEDSGEEVEDDDPSLPLEGDDQDFEQLQESSMSQGFPD